MNYFDLMHQIQKRKKVIDEISIKHQICDAEKKALKKIETAIRIMLMEQVICK